jgi:hypothetical protein
VQLLQQPPLGTCVRCLTALTCGLQAPGNHPGRLRLQATSPLLQCVLNGACKCVGEGPQAASPRAQEMSEDAPPEMLTLVLRRLDTRARFELYMLALVLAEGVRAEALRPALAAALAPAVQARRSAGD